MPQRAAKTDRKYQDCSRKAHIHMKLEREHFSVQINAEVAEIVRMVCFAAKKECTGLNAD